MKHFVINQEKNPQQLTLFGIHHSIVIMLFYPQYQEFMIILHLKNFDCCLKNNQYTGKREKKGFVFVFDYSFSMISLDISSKQLVHQI